MSCCGVLLGMTGAYGVCGGIATVNRNLVRALADLSVQRKGQFVILSLLESQNDRPLWLPERIEFFGFSGNKRAYSLKLLKMAIRRRPVCCFDHVRLALPLLPLAKLSLVRTVILAHGSESWKRIRRTSRLSFRAATLCLTNSHYTLKNMSRTFSGFQGRACPLGLSPDLRLNESLPPSSTGRVEVQAADGSLRQLSARVLLLVARMHPGEREKGHRQLIEVLPTLIQKFPDVQLVFPGPGDDCPMLRDLAVRLGVGHAVFIPGKVSQELLETLYASCFAFVMPSKQEGFGLVYLEAMNYAKPCLGCFDDGAEEVIVNGETGLLVRDPNDLPELRDALTDLLQDPRRARRLGENGFERLHRYYTAGAYQERVKHYISELF